jgi:hypothetical protein
MAAPEPPPFDTGLLLSLCAGLGGVSPLADGSGSAFVAGEEALACLQDLQRLLRRDEPATRDVVLTLAAWNTLEGKLVPLLVSYASNFELLFNAAKARCFKPVCRRRLVLTRPPAGVRLPHAAQRPGGHERGGADAGAAQVQARAAGGRLGAHRAHLPAHRAPLSARLRPAALASPPDARAASLSAGG